MPLLTFPPVWKVRCANFCLRGGRWSGKIVINKAAYTLILTVKGVVNMEITSIPFAQDVVKKAAAGGEVEFYNYSPNNRTGIKNLELKIYYPGGLRKIVVLHDYGFQITTEEIEVQPFINKAERNLEIWRLYNERNLSQNFLANFFGISQPSVSVIVKSCKNQSTD